MGAKLDYMTRQCHGDYEVEARLVTFHGRRCEHLNSRRVQSIQSSLLWLGNQCLNSMIPSDRCCLRWWVAGILQSIDIYKICNCKILKAHMYCLTQSSVLGLILWCDFICTIFSLFRRPVTLTRHANLVSVFFLVYLACLINSKRLNCVSKMKKNKKD